MTTGDLLDQLGWNAALAQQLQTLGDSTLVPARVTLEHNHVFRVFTVEGERLAEATGRLKHLAEGRRELPVVGDWVGLRPGAAGDRDRISALLPRRSWLSRKVAGRETEEQVVAANIDTVGLVFGLDLPVNRRSIERYVLVARRSGAEPVVVLNKTDVASHVAERVAEARLAAGDVTVVGISTRTGDGFAALEGYLSTGRTLALLGPSGAGKSSIVNRLVRREVLPTGEVREWDGRGRHTSVHRQLVIREGGGLIIDTPGMRELQLWDSDPVSETFVDVGDLAASCRFRDCRHESEPGCAVKAAVAGGLLDAGRYASFVKLQTEQVAIERKREERAQTIEKRTVKIRQKALRAFQKSRQRGE